MESCHIKMIKNEGEMPVRHHEYFLADEAAAERKEDVLLGQWTQSFPESVGFRQEALATIPPRGIFSEEVKSLSWKRNWN